MRQAANGGPERARSPTVARTIGMGFFFSSFYQGSLFWVGVGREAVGLVAAWVPFSVLLFCVWGGVWRLLQVLCTSNLYRAKVWCLCYLHTALTAEPLTCRTMLMRHHAVSSLLLLIPRNSGGGCLL
jgi:hypothetical protein